ncbi:very-long-chain (3R)-3-hydroxyacyl-CoA dehydratase, variant 2 [Balamuthia mandrillaris]
MTATEASTATPSAEDHTLGSGWQLQSTKAAAGSSSGETSNGFLFQLRKCYLAAYNLFIAVGWGYVLAQMLYSCIRRGGLGNALPFLFDEVCDVVAMLQWVVTLELVHIVCGLVPPSTVNVLVLAHCKVLRRLHILNIALMFIPEVVFIPSFRFSSPLLSHDVSLGPYDQLHSHPAAPFLFLHWGLLDLIRYPFYLLNMYGCCPRWLRWLRYSEFIVLYPISFISESTFSPFYLSSVLLRLLLAFLLFASFSSLLYLFLLSFPNGIHLFIPRTVYLWWLMLPYIYSKGVHNWTPLPDSLPWLGFNYFYFVCLYIPFRCYSAILSLSLSLSLSLLSLSVSLTPSISSPLFSFLLLTAQQTNSIPRELPAHAAASSQKDSKRKEEDKVKHLFLK